jgi:hypothetical protein
LVPDANKADLRKLALSLGIPESVIDRREYLNGKSKPTSAGLLFTQSLIDSTKVHVSKGENPSYLWTTPPVYPDPIDDVVNAITQED